MIVQPYPMWAVVCLLESDEPDPYRVHRVIGWYHHPEPDGQPHPVLWDGDCCHPGEALLPRVPVFNLHHNHDTALAEAEVANTRWIARRVLDEAELDATATERSEG
jgi:hypothetical protein